MEVKVTKLAYLIDTIRKRIWFLSFKNKKGTTKIKSDIVNGGLANTSGSNSGVGYFY